MKRKQPKILFKYQTERMKALAQWRLNQARVLMGTGESLFERRNRLERTWADCRLIDLARSHENLRREMVGLKAELVRDGRLRDGVG